MLSQYTFAPKNQGNARNKKEKEIPVGKKCEGSGIYKKN